MKIQGYEIDLENVVKTINKKNYRRVVLQLPEGLKALMLNSYTYLCDILNHVGLYYAFPTLRLRYFLSTWSQINCIQVHDDGLYNVNAGMFFLSIFHSSIYTLMVAVFLII